MPIIDIDIDAISKTVGKRIKARRKENGITQEELAEKIGISAKHISLIERGSNMRLDTIVKTAEILEMDYTYLITGNPCTFEHTEIESMVSRLTESQYNSIMEILNAFTQINQK